MPALAPIDARAARRLFLHAQALLEPPAVSTSAEVVQALVERLGFVQIDSINVLARAHDLTLASRLEGYRPEQLAALLARRSLFEHWTHDASVIPTAWYPHWKPRFARDAKAIRAHAWWKERIGRHGKRVMAEVVEKVAAEGPLSTSEFEHEKRGGPWWGWSPQKAALDYLWRSGVLAVHGRVNFQKVYDLAERVLPDHHGLSAPEAAEHVEWACATAMDRLLVFTPRELAGFWDAIDLSDARRWCQQAEKGKRIVRVLVAAEDGSRPQESFAVADWEARADALPEPSARLRLLSPFDPVIRDRARALRRFAFDYRFEAFTPAPKRRFGYYVLPMLEGDQAVGRVEPKLQRDESALEIRGVWWERGFKSKARERLLDDALARLAKQVGAASIRGR
ncbi:MAG: crosslink repair DNA glycosylase YcaQ family protein [Myxococcales bacterium]